MKWTSKKGRIGCIGIIALLFGCGLLSRLAPTPKAAVPTTAARQLVVSIATDTPIPTATSAPILVATDTPIPTAPPAAPTDTPVVVADNLTLVALKDANLRAGPGTDFAVAGHAAMGQTLNITGHNEDSSWYQLADQTWIAAFLAGSPDALTPAEQPVAAVQDASPATPTDTPIAVVDVPTPTPEPVQIGGTLCKDGTISHSTGRGTCSHHGGIQR